MSEGLRQPHQIRCAAGGIQFPGATDSPDVVFAEEIEIAAVPAGDVKTTRPGVAHYHVGIDQRCLPAGKTIVKGTP